MNDVIGKCIEVYANYLTCKFHLLFYFLLTCNFNYNDLFVLTKNFAVISFVINNLAGRVTDFHDFSKISQTQISVD